jgi:hypothetical protein
VWDDYFNLAKRSHSLIFDQTLNHFRPFWYYSFYFLQDLLETPAGHRSINIAMVALSAVVLGSILNKADVRYPWAFALIVFAQPSYVYPATWITLRVDCFIILFLILTFRNFENRWGLLFLICSDFSKAPFLLQNLWYGIIKFREGRRLLAAFVILIMILIMGLIVTYWLGVNAVSSSPTSKLSLDPLEGLVVILMIRTAKVLEGIFLIHFPVFAYYSQVTILYSMLAFSAMAACWLTIIVDFIRHRPRIPALAKHSLILAVLSSLPFAIVTDPRVLGPAIPFWFMFWIIVGANRMRIVVPLALLGAMGLGGTLLNYKVSDTGVYVLDPKLDYTVCGPHELKIPAEQWRCDRFKFASMIIERINILGK